MRKFGLTMYKIGNFNTFTELRLSFQIFRSLLVVGLQVLPHRCRISSVSVNIRVANNAFCFR